MENKKKSSGPKKVGKIAAGVMLATALASACGQSNKENDLRGAFDRKPAAVLDAATVGEIQSILNEIKELKGQAQTMQSAYEKKDTAALDNGVNYVNQGGTLVKIGAEICIEAVKDFQKAILAIGEEDYTTSEYFRTRDGKVREELLGDETFKADSMARDLLSKMSDSVQGEISRNVTEENGNLRIIPADGNSDEEKKKAEDIQLFYGRLHDYIDFQFGREKYDRQAKDRGWPLSGAVPKKVEGENGTYIVGRRETSPEIWEAINNYDTDKYESELRKEIVSSLPDYWGTPAEKETLLRQIVGVKRIYGKVGCLEFGKDYGFSDDIIIQTSGGAGKEHQ
jgi:hypothetical protein